MNRVFFSILLVLGALLPMPHTAWAVEEIKEAEYIGDDTRADDWFSTQYGGGAGDGMQANSIKDGLKFNRTRYMKFYWDDSFTYRLDTESIRWLLLPYSSTEYILDVWVKMDPAAGQTDYSYPQKYYMEHYYLRPEKQQVQFLSELEVSGHPQNAIKERAYDYRNWESLVPGSVEEKVYYAVMSILKDLEKDGTVKKRPRDYDFLDDTLRIGGIF